MPQSLYSTQSYLHKNDHRGSKFETGIMKSGCNLMDIISFEHTTSTRTIGRVVLVICMFNQAWMLPGGSGSCNLRQVQLGKKTRLCISVKVTYRPRHQSLATPRHQSTVPKRWEASPIADYSDVLPHCELSDGVWTVSTHKL